MEDVGEKKSLVFGVNCRCLAKREEGSLFLKHLACSLARTEKFRPVCPNKNL
jgi:hypothetical protein